MEIQIQNIEGKVNLKGIFLMVIIALCGLVHFQNAYANFGTPTRYEAENGFNSMSSTSSANAGYSGSGYVTGLIQNGSETKFDKGFSAPTLVKLDIHYANGTGTNITNLALYIGSNQKIQDLVFPSTGSWTTWSTITVAYTQDPSWGSNIIIKSTASVGTSANIDYTDLYVNDGITTPAVSTPTFTPAAGSYTSAQSVTIGTATTGATIYYTQDGSTPTTSSTVYSSAISVGATKTLKALAIKSGMTNSAVASATYTINLPIPAPGSFTQTAPARGATGVSITPAFNWAASSNASSYSLVVSTNSSYTSPVINQTGLTSISYTTSTALANSTVYYWKVTAVNSTASTVASNAGLSFTAIAPLPTVATPTFSPVAGTYTSAQSVTISTTTTGTIIYYTTDGSTPTTSSNVYSAAISVGSTQTIKALAARSGYNDAPVSSAAYTINIPVPTPSAFTQSAPASGATGVSTTPSFSWVASSNAASYAIVVSASNSYTSPVINQTGLTGTSFTPSTALSNSTVYYWKVTATNATGSTVATNAGLSFTTAAVPVGGTGNVLREYWAGISGTSVSSLTSNANFPNSPTSTSLLTQFQSPTDVADNYGQRVKGYVTAPSTGAYKFWISSDDDSELWLSTDASEANKVKIASVTGWTSPAEWTKYPSQASASINLVAGTQYYIEALQKEGAGGDNLAVAWQILGGSQVIIPGSALSTTSGIMPAVAAIPTFTPAAGTYSSTQSVTLSTATTGATIYYTVDGNAPTTSSTVYSSAISVAATQTIKAIAVKSGMSNSTMASATYTISSIPVPAPGSFSQTAPASGATSVSTTPTFSWGASSNAASYSLVVSTSSSYASPAVNVSGLTGTSYNSGALTASTTYYWKVTAVNGTGSTVATNAGLSFTTGAIPQIGSGPGYIYREYWSNIPGQAVSDLTSSAAFAGAPNGATNLTSFEAPRNFADNYGQRIEGYLAPTVTGAYIFYIASDNDSELWLSTNNQAANKVKIAYVIGYNSPQEWTKYDSQTSATINLTAGNLYYIEALHKEADQGDNVAVGWKVPGSSTINVIPGDNLSTYIPSAPAAFSQTTPASGATAISTVPTFTWAASTGAQNYSLVLSTSSSFASPVINQSGITVTSFTSPATLTNGTVYYWKVTATNIAGSTVASNAGISFTTAAATPPVSFNQTSPAAGATGVSWTPNFTWAASSNANTYTLVVSTSSSYTSPVINQSGITLTNYTPSSNLSASTVYYWKVIAVNPRGSTVASNAGLSFTTAAVPPAGSTFYVATSGSDTNGDGSSGNPWRTVAYAAAHVTGTNKTINVGPGTFSETQAIVLGVGVSLKGAGESSTTITSAAAIPSPGFDASNKDWKLMYHGSLIQLISPGYSGDSPHYGDPSLMIPSTDGSQTLSDFTIDGNAKKVKAGVWVLNRNNVTMHHVTIKNCDQRGAVFSRSDMWWYVVLPDGKWMNNTTIYNCTFINTTTALTEELLGALCIGGLDGANIYNITINDNAAEGIKFIYVGHYRNVKIHDVTMTLNEAVVLGNWPEPIAIELWNLSKGNEIYNINCNTWLSIVNHKNIYDNVTGPKDNLWIHNIKIVDNDGISNAEAVECATPGMTVSDSYFKDKALGMAVWMEGKKYMTINNNIFYNQTDHSKNWAAGAGVYVPDVVDGLNIYNNVFEYFGTTIHMKGSVTNCNIKNNVFINPIVEDVYSPNNSFNFTNNIKYTADNLPWKIEGSANMSNNYLANPGFKNTGNRWDTYYQPTASSFAVDKGVNVGLPFSGSAPDIGKWELGLTSSREAIGEEVHPDADGIGSYPNPTTGIIKIASNPDVKIIQVQVSTTQGKILLSKLGAELKSGEIDLSIYPNDIYILSVKHQRGMITKKVVLVK